LDCLLLVLLLLLLLGNRILEKQLQLSKQEESSSEERLEQELHNQSAFAHHQGLIIIPLAMRVDSVLSQLLAVTLLYCRTGL